MERCSWRVRCSVVVSLCLVGACSSSSTVIDRFAPDGSDDDAAAPTDAAVCSGPLAQVGMGCPATFDGSLDAIPCIHIRAPIAMYACGSSLVLAWSSGYAGLFCAYDGATQALVGAEVEEDTPGYCEGSFRQVAGLVPEACVRGTPTSTGTCTLAPGDGGQNAHDGAASDAVSE